MSHFRNLGVAAKLGVSFAALCGLILLCGLAGRYGVQRMADGLDEVTGPAWATAHSGMEARIGVQREIIAIHHLLNPNREETAARADYESAHAFAAAAMERVFAADPIPAEMRGELRREYAAYAAARDELLGGFDDLTTTPARFTALNADYDAAVATLLTRLVAVE
ncbi:MAG: hypothetical protein AB7I32_21135, partial [Gammaproteobacteria bacterium]